MMFKYSLVTKGFALLVLLFGWVSKSYCHYEPSLPSSTSSERIIGFDIHHRFSDRVKSLFPVDDFPEKGTAEYFSAMVHRDRIRGRRLASGDGSTDLTPLTFHAGNETGRIAPFGFLYYAIVSVGTPSLNFLVALDTGSDLFWLPCDCPTCKKFVKTTNGLLKFNMYSLNTSSSGSKVPCKSEMCPSHESCTSGPADTCSYQIDYLSENTSSKGYIVEDVLHLTADVRRSTLAVDATIAFGCGTSQTGALSGNGAPNGLMGLGLTNMSVPNMLASQNLVSRSFSMCFHVEGSGRISFGDQGSSDQTVSPLVNKHSLPTYDVSITQISVGTNVTDIDAVVIFDTGSSFSLLRDPAYSFIAENFHAQAKGKRAATEFKDIFEYCYEMSSCEESDVDVIPSINLTMKGGAQFNLLQPIVIVQYNQFQCVYCLGLAKSDYTISIIGENFMTGYRIVFNQEKMVLGWKESDCNYVSNSSTSLAISPESAQTVPSTLDPEAAAGPTVGTSSSEGRRRSPPAFFTLFFCAVVFSLYIDPLSNL